MKSHAHRVMCMLFHAGSQAYHMLTPRSLSYVASDVFKCRDLPTVPFPGRMYVFIDHEPFARGAEKSTGAQPFSLACLISRNLERQTPTSNQYARKGVKSDLQTSSQAPHKNVERERWPKTNLQSSSSPKSRLAVSSVPSHFRLSGTSPLPYPS